MLYLYLLSCWYFMVLVATRFIMLVKVGFQCKWFITFPTLVILKWGMCLHVCSQVRSVSKTFSTMCTSKRFVSSMRSIKWHKFGFVVLMLTLIVGGNLLLPEGVWLYPQLATLILRVNLNVIPQVAFEQPRSWKSFSTGMTLVVETMG